MEIALDRSRGAHLAKLLPADNTVTIWKNIMTRARPMRGWQHRHVADDYRLRGKANASWRPGRQLSVQQEQPNSMVLQLAHHMHTAHACNRCLLKLSS